MDGQGMGSCVKLFSVPSGFLVSPSVKLLVGGRGWVGKGGSRVLIPDLVVMARVGASDVSSRQAYLLEWVIQLTFIGLMRSSAVLFKRPLSMGCIAFEMEETLMKGDGSSYRSSWYWTYSSIRIHPSSSALLMVLLSPCLNRRIMSLRAEVGGILSSHSAAFPLREKWKNLNLDVSLVDSSTWVGGLGPVLMDEDASSSKRFLLAIARESF
ncbi:hypothetical protein Tco_1212647 [Tanacetum coccineum]